MATNLFEAQGALNQHPLFTYLKDGVHLRQFMESHVYAVWDFMSLLKRLQREMTCVEVPWRPSRYPDELVRFINQIVVGEESDLDQHGHAISHFSLYLKAMEEVGASTAGIKNFLRTMNTQDIPEHVRPFTEFTLQTAQEASVIEVAASFFYGREKLIPGMFTGMINELKKDNVQCPTLMYYLERHVEVDGEEHGPLSEQCLEILCEGSAEKKAQALNFGLKALEERQNLWDRTLTKMRN